MKSYDKNKESLYHYMLSIGIQCLKSYFLVVLNGLKEDDNVMQDFIKSYNKDSNIGYFIEAGVQYLEKLHKLHNDLPFLHERMNIKRVEKPVANLYDKNEYVVHIRNF